MEDASQMSKEDRRRALKKRIRELAQDRTGGGGGGGSGSSSGAGRAVKPDSMTALFSQIEDPQILSCASSILSSLPRGKIPTVETISQLASEHMPAGFDCPPIHEEDREDEEEEAPPVR